MGSTRQKSYTRRKAIKAQKHTWIMVSEEDEGTNDVNVGKGFYKSIQELWSWVYIYSSGSREAQKLVFGNTVYGDLRKYLCGFFDTTIGHKRESRSYFEISQSLGVDKPSQILFVTDVYQEAVAAKAAGLDVLIAIRPGNGPLPEAHGFKTIKAFSEI